MLLTRYEIIVIRCRCAQREEPTSKLGAHADPASPSSDEVQLSTNEIQPEGPVSVIRSALGQLEDSRGHLGAVEDGLHQSSSGLSLVGQEFQESLLSIEEATYDSRDTDVSDYGYAVKGSFGRVSGHLQTTRGHLAEVESENLGFYQDIEAISESLEAVRDQIDDPEARDYVDRALEDLEQADEQYVETYLEAFQADRQSRYLQGETNYNLYVEKLIADRPGIDVRFEARQLQNKVESYTEWNLVKANEAIHGALWANGRAQKETNEAEESLGRALELLGVELPPTQESQNDSAPATGD